MIEPFARWIVFSTLSLAIGLKENALYLRNETRVQNVLEPVCLKIGSLGGFDIADILLDGLLCKFEAVATDLSHFLHF